VRASDSVGCLITIVNKTDKIVKIGVSPHGPAGDPGANYREIAPSAEGLYDVRYPEMNEIKIHAHPNIRHTMRVIYGEGCR